MMRRFLGQVRQSFDKFDRGCEVPELKCPADHSSLFCPSRQKAERSFCLGGRILCHIFTFATAKPSRNQIRVRKIKFVAVEVTRLESLSFVVHFVAALCRGRE